MSQGHMLRMRNKHCKVAFTLDGNIYSVVKTTCTLTPKVGDLLIESEVQSIIDKGLTVTVTGK